MSIPRFSQLGLQMVLGFRRGKALSLPRRFHLLKCHTRMPPNCYFRDVKHLFSTSTEDSDTGNQQKEDMISMTFFDKDGEEKLVKVPVGMSVLEAAHANDIELEGACEASLACSTCHVIVTDMEFYNKLDDPTDEENDMLDLALGLTKTSRLGCQIIAKPEIDGIRVAVPAATRNFALDGHVAKAH
ncbi:unnamed protein product [Victoria cruziana]